MSDTEYNVAELVDIDPSKCGAVAPMFKKITLEVKFGYFDFTKNGGNRGYKVYLKYSYEHNSAGDGYSGNGYTVGYITVDDCASFQIY